MAHPNNKKRTGFLFPCVNKNYRNPAHMVGLLPNQAVLGPNSVPKDRHSETIIVGACEHIKEKMFLD